MRPDPEMIALGLNIRIHYLEVDKLRALWSPINPHIIVIQQLAKEESKNKVVSPSSSSNVKVTMTEGGTAEIRASFERSGAAILFFGAA